MNTDLINWDEDLAVDSEEEYQAILNGLKRSQGFSLYFVQCSPFSSENLIERIKADLSWPILARLKRLLRLSSQVSQLPEKKIGVLKFEHPIADGNVFKRINSFLQEHDTDVLFIQGLENSLIGAEETRKRLGWNQEKIEKLNWREVSPVLNNLNQQRERFRDTFKTCFVFLLPQYAIDCLVQRAPDFFDWRSGLFTYISTAKTLAQESQRILAARDYEAYCNWSLEERNQRLSEIQSLVEQLNLGQEIKAQLFFEQALIFATSENEDSEAEIAAYDAALRAKPDYHRALYIKGAKLASLGRDEEAIICFDAALAIQPDNPVVLNNKGHALSGLERYEEAIICCDAALAIQPDNLDALNNKGRNLSVLGMKLIEAGNGDEAFAKLAEGIRSHNIALALEPNHESTRKGITLGILATAIALRSSGRYEETIAYYDAALAIQPSAPEIFIDKGYALSKLGRYEDAITSYDAALNIQPDVCKALYMKGNALANLGWYEAAIDTYDMALNIQPDTHETLFNKGNALGNLGQFEAAIAAYDAVLAIKPDKYAALYNKGAALGELGQHDAALAAYDAALAIKPDKDEALNNKGIALGELGRYEEAIAAYDAALALKPDKHEALDNKGLALANLGRYEEAIAAYNAAIKINAEAPKPYYNKACCYGLQGKVEPALEYLQQAIQLSPEEYRELAQTDTDFDVIRNDSRFQALIMVENKVLESKG
ncbi:MAG: tetratricopeptide repeat protein [Cyanobacteria bacterium P01_H01_bin.162]